MFEEKPGHAKLKVLQKAFSDAIVEPPSRTSFSFFINLVQIKKDIDLKYE